MDGQERGKKSPSFCSPARYNAYLTSGTCFTEAELRELGRGALGRAALRDSADAAKLVARLSAELGQEAWTWPDKVKARDISLRALRPQSPCSWRRNDREWLYSTDIHKVLKQYEDKHADFAFLGVFASDEFEKDARSGRCAAGGTACEFDPVEDLLADGKSKFAAVFNLDEHDEDGSHWVALYVDTSREAVNRGVFYYDSVGRPPIPKIRSFMERLGERLGGLPLAHNSTKRQFEDTECGVFAMFFVICCLENKMPFREICASMGRDDAIHALRGVLYRPNTNCNK